MRQRLQIVKKTRVIWKLFIYGAYFEIDEHFPKLKLQINTYMVPESANEFVYNTCKTHMEFFFSNGGYPPKSSIYRWDFPWNKPSISGPPFRETSTCNPVFGGTYCSSLLLGNQTRRTRVSWLQRDESTKDSALHLTWSPIKLCIPNNKRHWGWFILTIP
jgi:hypothetical protein